MAGLGKCLLSVVFTLLVLPNTLGAGVAAAYSSPVQPILRVFIYPNSSIYDHLIAYSSHKRVLVIDDTVSPTRFLSSLAARFLGKNSAGEKPLSPLVEGRILERLNALLAASSGGGGLRARVSGLIVWGNGVVWARVETPHPGGLGERFGRLLAANISRVVGDVAGVKAKVVVITYEPPRADEAAEAIQELVDTRLASVLGNTSHAVGVSVAPLLEIDYGVTKQVSLKQLADLVESVLPRDSWALIVVHKVFPKPSPLVTKAASTAPSTSQAWVKEGGRVGDIAPRGGGSSTPRSPSYTSGGKPLQAVGESTTFTQHGRSDTSTWPREGLLVGVLAALVLLTAYLLARRMGQGA